MVPREGPRSNFEAERAELEAVLSSRIFTRAPSLSRILSYVCQKYFEGDTNSIKEYNIGVEALGRGPDFQPSTDSIVRVEFSRLRKRLQEFYQTEGKDRPLELQLAPSGYMPRFVRRDKGPAANGENGNGQPAIKSERVEPPAPEPAALTAGGTSHPRLQFSPRVFGLAVLLLAVLAGLVYGLFHLAAGGDGEATVAAGVTSVTTGSSKPGDLPRPPEPGAGSREAIRISVGSTLPKYIDVNGHTWLGDRWFEGGTAITRTDRRVLGTLDPHLYQTARQGRFQYKIPLAPGRYELRLHFAEIVLGESTVESSADGVRRFDITLNGQLLLNGLDIVSDAGGPNMVNEKIFVGVSPAEDGFLHLGFSPFRDVALLNGIEILPSDGKKMHPVRIVTGSRAHYDSSEAFWSADRYFRGGNIARRSAHVQATDPGLYATERWGNFTYVIPVAKGRYTLTLKFAESYFVEPNVPPGARLFDVYCNGVALLRNFDILKEAGRPNYAIDKVFKGVSPNAQDKLIISFVPVQDYAIINAIEVVQE
ncbi:MAG TPA: malectin domain-containing carbohydrate-binding protein [Bryobacteraceae bacterium]|nr:malectin domain-containing carbohydrate-binding protein [Bryobacteraceae bacterium]HOQ44860.1 malectin domain-containing carbohydrate-binding protein [Bryobacteraceae bacterium]HPQ16408.1 malectin domain-containing carbohydrate-binding protein [Bryobacteraceae bacterium]HPU72129.1 malectin domain-containing carbohydrate-binding protein [Bryobacteraceae bacterium]